MSAVMGHRLMMKKCASRNNLIHPSNVYRAFLLEVR
jgi:hypothetical protein